MTQTQIDFEKAKGYPDTVVDKMIAVVEWGRIDQSFDDMQSELHDLFLEVPIELRAYVYRAFTEELRDLGYYEDEITTIARGDA